MKRHEFDVIALVAGLVFLAGALVWPLWRLDTIGLNDIAWFAGVALVGIGVTGVAVSLLRASRADRDHPADPAA